MIAVCSDCRVLSCRGVGCRGATGALAGGYRRARVYPGVRERRGGTIARADQVGSATGGVGLAALGDWWVALPRLLVVHAGVGGLAALGGGAVPLLLLLGTGGG